MNDTRLGHSSLRVPVALLSVLWSAGPMLAGEHHQKKVNAPATDSINVVGHLAIQGGAITAIRTSEYWKRNYVELQDPLHGTLTIVDVTNAAKPCFDKQFKIPEPLDHANLEALVGSTALLTDQPSQSTATVTPRSVSIVSFADPTNPRVVQQFANVTAIRADPQRGLIYLVNSDGLWVLQQHPASNLEVERATRG